MNRFTRKLKSTLFITLLFVFVVLFIDLKHNLSVRNVNSIPTNQQQEKGRPIRSKFTHMVNNVIETFDKRNPGKLGSSGDLEVNAYGQLKDWHDYQFIENEMIRTGLGEQGKPVHLQDSNEIKINNELFDETGFSVIVSNKISVNRSIPDMRHDSCKDILYMRDLPAVSVIVIYYNEVLSVLKRTIHSIWNRTPSGLLHEIILVNDKSNNKELYKPLADYVNKHFSPNKVKIINLSKRKGLMVARMQGARTATGKILVFLDSHIEVGTNYLPPLIEPIVQHKRIATVPIHDYINPDSFEILLNKNHTGSRGVVDWKLDFHEFPKRPIDMLVPYQPFPTPIMLGCAFAIDREFFFELGGFDEGMRIWNGENYELSFKLWLCAGGLYQVPCSRVAHSFRDINPSRKVGYDFVARNFLRLSEVWLDDYKELVIASNPERYKNLYPGDLTKAKSIKEKLNCKPFKYFLEVIAPDMADTFPPFLNPPVFASGYIKNIGTELCITRVSKDILESTQLTECSANKTHPQTSQKFYFTFHKNIVHQKSKTCFDSHQSLLFQCSSFESGNQYWKYDLNSKLLVNGVDYSDKCLSANGTATEIKDCDRNDANQKWEFGYVNETALNDWENINGYQNYL